MGLGREGSRAEARVTGHQFCARGRTFLSFFVAVSAAGGGSVMLVETRSGSSRQDELRGKNWLKIGRKERLDLQRR